MLSAQAQMLASAVWTPPLWSSSSLWVAFAAVRLQFSSHPPSHLLHTLAEQAWPMPAVSLTQVGAGGSTESPWQEHGNNEMTLHELGATDATEHGDVAGDDGNIKHLIFEDVSEGAAQKDDSY